MTTAEVSPTEATTSSVPGTTTTAAVIDTQVTTQDTSASTIVDEVK